MAPQFDLASLPLNTIVNTDVLAYLRGLPDECAHCCVTSPPYWGLRDYGLAPSHWDAVEYAPIAGLAPVSIPAMDACLGLEPTPDAFVGHIVEVFREVRRVLRADGTLWLNFGDSYAMDTKWGGSSGGKNITSADGKYSRARKTTGLKPKDLVGIPWRVALALQADGWYLRSDVIWAKPNPMPESVTDRPTKAHEYVFLLSKSQRYFYDADAVKEQGVTTRPDLLEFGDRVDVGFTGHMNDRRRAKTSDKQAGHGRRHAGFNDRWDAKEDAGDMPVTRNLRSVWTIATQAFAEAHFATFPPELPKRCIMAGTSERGCCAACGAPLARVTKKSGGTIGKSWHDHSDDLNAGMSQVNKHSGGLSKAKSDTGKPYSVETTGWARSCLCEPYETALCTVLEPFAGAGTVPLVATGLQRNWLACELNPEYIKIAERRLDREVGLLRLAAAAAE